ncbi:MAG: pyridoxine 5'-phosphate synthase [Calditrichia bacterium]
MVKRLTISVDDVATLRYVLKDTDFDPVQYAILAEVAGASGISVTLADSDRGLKESDIRTLRKVYKSFLNLHIPIDPQMVKIALGIKPDMVTFVDVSQSGAIAISPLSTHTLVETLPGVLSDFRASQISVAAFAMPEINLLKQLNRIDVDFVEFDCSEITRAADSNDELVALDKLHSAVLGAAKLGIGVNCYGSIGYQHLPYLARIPRIEDICMGLSIVKRAMLVGVQTAVQEANQQLMLNQRD